MAPKCYHSIGINWIRVTQLSKYENYRPMSFAFGAMCFAVKAILEIQRTTFRMEGFVTTHSLNTESIWLLRKFLYVNIPLFDIEVVSSLNKLC